MKLKAGDTGTSISFARYLTVRERVTLISVSPAWSPTLVKVELDCLISLPPRYRLPIASLSPC